MYERYTRKALQRRADVRIDGRTPIDMRNVRVDFATKYGAVEVQLGRTKCVPMFAGRAAAIAVCPRVFQVPFVCRVYSCVTAELVAPFPDRPAEVIDRHLRYVSLWRYMHGVHVDRASSTSSSTSRPWRPMRSKRIDRRTMPSRLVPLQFGGDGNGDGNGVWSDDDWVVGE